MAADRFLQFEVPRPSGSIPLLWPVRVWKIIYPIKRITKINFFQQAILQLIRARCNERQEIAEFLGLDSELVAFIMATQLIPNGWMTAQGILTPRGELVLDESEEVADEVRMGYAFQDAVSGNLLPRFTDELPEIEPRGTGENGFPIFLKNKDSGDSISPFKLKHLVEGQLNVPALFDAFKKYRTDYDRAKQMDERQLQSNQLKIGSLSLVGDTSEPMWLWTWVFKDLTGNQPWLISDPFGLQQAAVWLRKPLQDNLLRNEGLAKYIAQMLNKDRTTELTSVEWLRSLENKIDLTLLADYSWSLKVPVIQGYLGSVLRQKEVLLNKEAAWSEEIRSLLIETSNLAESVLQWMLDAYPPEAMRLPSWKVQKDWKNKQEALDYLNYSALACLTEDVIKRLSEQQLNQVRSAVNKHSGAVKALLFAAVLSTVDQQQHPFHSLTSDQLEFNKLLLMADDRNKKGGHAGALKSSKEEAIEHAEFVIGWVETFKDWY